MKLNLVSLKQAVGSVLDFDFKQENVELDLNREDILFVGPLGQKAR